MLGTSPLPAKERLALDSVEVLGRLAALFDERRRQLAESVGLTVGQWQVLEEIQETHFMPSLFAQKRASSPAAVSKVLRQLTDKELIVAQLSAHDARHRDYAVTPRGQEVLESLRVQRKQAVDEVWMSFSTEQLERFHALGSELASRLQAWAKHQASTR